jgi:hypothetical protein
MPIISVVAFIFPAPEIDTPRGRVRERLHAVVDREIGYGISLPFSLQSYHTVHIQ